MRTRRLVACLSLVSLAALTAGCGLTTSDAPEVLSKDNLPEELGGPSDTTGLDIAEGDGVNVRLWFVDDEEERTVLTYRVAQVPNQTPQVVLERLLSYDQDDLEEDGLTSALPSGLTVRVEAGEDGELTVDLPEAFYEDPDTGMGRFALGQVVLTATTLPDIDRVRFLEDGNPKRVRDGEGQTHDRPVGADDYSVLRE